MQKVARLMRLRTPRHSIQNFVVNLNSYLGAPWPGLPHPGHQVAPQVYRFFCCLLNISKLVQEQDLPQPTPDQTRHAVLVPFPSFPSCTKTRPVTSV